MHYAARTNSRESPSQLQAYGPAGLGILTVSGVPGFAELRQRLLPLAQAFAVSAQCTWCDCRIATCHCMHELPRQSISLGATLLITSHHACRPCPTRSRTFMLTLPASITLVGATVLKDLQTDSQTDTKARTMPTLLWMYPPQTKHSSSSTLHTADQTFGQHSISRSISLHSSK